MHFSVYAQKRRSFTNNDTLPPQNRKISLGPVIKRGVTPRCFKTTTQADASLSLLSHALTLVTPNSELCTLTPPCSTCSGARKRGQGLHPNKANVEIHSRLVTKFSRPSRTGKRLPYLGNVTFSEFLRTSRETPAYKSMRHGPAKIRTWSRSPASHRQRNRIASNV